MNVLVINSGSSSIKYQLLDMASRRAVLSGLMERIGEAESRVVHRELEPGQDAKETTHSTVVRNHREGVRRLGEFLEHWLGAHGDAALFGVGHRVVHGGEEFHEPTLIDEGVLAAVRRHNSLAPLHNPANVLGIEVAQEEFPHTPQVAVFDTAFHQTLPPWAYRYALPAELYTDRQIRRYGFHGTSHSYVSQEAARHLQRPLDELNFISLHLGNGASAAAIRGGQSVDTSMGLTPLEGLVMGTRCGDIDPAIILHLANTANLSLDELDALLNQQSGLKGICGDNDMRAVLRRAAGGDSQAELAVNIYTYRIKKYIGAYSAALGRVDALIFTAGVGENSAEIRARCCDGLANLGVILDDEKNAAPNSGNREIQADGSAVKILVIPTNEELEIAEQTVRCIQASPSR